MSRFFLALRCFFAVLLRSTLPPQAIALLMPIPGPQVPPQKLLPEAKPEAKPAAEPPKPAPKPVETQPEPPPVAAPPAAEPAPNLKAGDLAAACRRGGVQMLSLLQREGRLLDFLMEDIDSYADAQIGAAVRDIHRGCRKALGEHLKVRPIRAEPDEAVVKIPDGYDPSQIRLVGRVTGRPPFEGTLRHHGWRTGDINLSDIPAGHDPSVICPAEVEIGA